MVWRNGAAFVGLDTGSTARPKGFVPDMQDWPVSAASSFVTFLFETHKEMEDRSRGESVRPDH